MTELRVLERAPPGLVEALAADYAARGLRPCVDAELDLVLVDCVYCRAQDQDPIGMYRPMRVVPRARMTRGGRPATALLTIICNSCGYHDERSL